MKKTDKLVWKRKEESDETKFPPEKWGLKGHWVTDDEIEEARKIEKRVKRIIDKSEFSLSKEMEEDLLSSIDHFLYKRSHLKKHLSHAEKKALMENLKNSAAAFAISLEDIKNPVIKRDIPMPVEQKSNTAIRELIKISKMWGNAASQAIPTGKSGPQPIPFIPEFALQLAKIFEQATGNPATAGYWDSKNSEIRGNKFPPFFAKILGAVDKDISLLKKSGEPDYNPLTEEELPDVRFRNLHEFLKKVLSDK